MPPTPTDRSSAPERTVRDAVLDVVRHHGMTTIFANPGSTEIPFLTGLPDDIRFVLALHEGSVVGMATGWAMTRGRPALVNVHTTAGLANAAGALATARTNRVPLVVVVGQQDRRHVAHEPFLTGRLQGLLGEYPVWTCTPLRPQEVPGAVARAAHEAVAGQGPAVVVVPMDDWDQPAPQVHPAAPAEVVHAPAVPDDLAPLAARLDAAERPVLVVGSGLDSEAGWAAAEALAERLGSPVWQEPFGARAGFPQDHPSFAGHLPPGREGVRGTLAEHDLVLVLGAAVFRQYPYEQGDLVPDGVDVVQVTAHGDEAFNSVADTTLVADPASVAGTLAGLVRDRGRADVGDRRPEPVDAPAEGEPLRAAHVFDLLAQHLPADTILVEESPSSRPDLHRRVPARAPLGFVSAAAGGLGFGLPVTVGLKMGAPDRPVVGVLGDGSSMYGIQALWSAAHYQVGSLLVVLSNGGYAIMDRLAERSERGKAPWPSFEGVSMSTIAEGLGCPTLRVRDHATLTSTLAELLPRLAHRETPLLLEVEVAPDEAYA